MQFKALLKRYMRKNKFSSRKTAEVLGTTQRNIFYWRSGLHKPPKTKIDLLLCRMGYGSQKEI
jgi:hypothetical protein